MTTDTKVQGSVNAIMAASGVGLAVSLVIVVANLFSSGHASFNSASEGVNWGMPIATYVFLALTATGLTFVSSLALVSKEWYPIAKRCVWLALAAMVAGFAALAFELGHPFRMLWAMPLAFQFNAPMYWMGVFYTLYAVLLLVKFRKMNAGDWSSASYRSISIASLVSVIIASGTLGLIFGMMAMRPIWYDPLMPIHFLLTGALSGMAFSVLITYIAYGRQDAMPEGVRALMTGVVPTVFAAVLSVAFIAHIARAVTGLWSNADGMQVWDHLVSGPWFWLQFGSMVVALFILFSPKLRSAGNMQLAASVLVILAAFIGVYQYIIGGQLVPMFKGSWVPGLIDYTPSLTEWMLVLLAASATCAIYALGERKFNLGATPAEAP